MIRIFNEDMALSKYSTTVDHWKPDTSLNTAAFAAVGYIPPSVVGILPTNGRPLSDIGVTKVLSVESIYWICRTESYQYHTDQDDCTEQSIELADSLGTLILLTMTRLEPQHSRKLLNTRFCPLRIHLGLAILSREKGHGCEHTNTSCSS